MEKNALLYLLGRIAAGLLALGSIALFSLLLSESDYTNYSLILSIAVFVNIVFFQWLSFGSIHSAVSNKSLINELDFKYLMALLVTMAPFALVAAVFGFISTTYFDLLSLVIFLSLGLAFFDWFTWKLHVEKTPVLFAIYDVSRAFLFLFFGLIAIFFGFDFVSFMLAISLAYFVMPVLRIFKGFIHSFKKNHYDDKQTN